jgi:hypothetical protein
MAREITAEQFAALEEVHGQGMVVTLSVGEDDFAFRRPGENDVDLVLAGKAEVLLSYHEECAIRCLLAPEAPKVKNLPEEDVERPAAERQLLVAEKERMRALWAQAPFLRDAVGVGFAELCGWGLELASAPLGGGRYRITARTPARATVDGQIEVELTARVFTGAEYSEFRKRAMTSPEGVAERYAWKTLVSSGNKEEVARRYPYLVISVGQLLQTLGSEGKAVRPKAFGAGRAPQPGSSTESPATET